MECLHFDGCLDQALIALLLADPLRLSHGLQQSRMSLIGPESTSRPCYLPALMLYLYIMYI